MSDTPSTSKDTFDYTIWDNETSIDEAMIPYFGRHSMKQHIRGKPIRFGYKSWCWNSKNGYLIDFDIYQGAKGSSNLYREKFGLGGSVMLQFCERLPKTPNGGYLPHRIYADNFFTSLDLIDRMTELGIGFTGTIRSNRLQKCPVENLKKYKRGTHHVVFDKKYGILLCQWNDNSIVTLASNCDNVLPLTSAKRYSFSESKKIRIDQPNLIKNYNDNMGGTDRMDQNVTYYRTSIRSKKWYWPLVIWGLDVAVNNAWLLHKQMCQQLKDETQLDLLHFRRSVAKSLLSFGIPKKKPGPSSSISNRVTSDIRYDNKNHLITSQDKRTRCALCKSTTIKKCVKCNIALHEKCFITFHVKTNK